MIEIVFILLIVCVWWLLPGKPDLSKYSHDAKGLAKIQEDFKAQFGADTYYTNVSVSYTDVSNLIFSAIVAEDPASLKLRKWVYTSHSDWRITGDVLLEVESNSDPKDFMFQLGGKFDLSKVGSLVEQSAGMLAEEKNIKDAALDMALLGPPDNDVAAKTKISISMRSKECEATFFFTYDLDGNLIDFSHPSFSK